MKNRLYFCSPHRKADKSRSCDSPVHDVGLPETVPLFFLPYKSSTHFQPFLLNLSWPRINPFSRPTGNIHSRYLRHQASSLSTKSSARQKFLFLVRWNDPKADLVSDWSHAIRLYLWVLHFSLLWDVSYANRNKTTPIIAVDKNLWWFLTWFLKLGLVVGPVSKCTIRSKPGLTMYSW